MKECVIEQCKNHPNGRDRMSHHLLYKPPMTINICASCHALIHSRSFSDNLSFEIPRHLGRDYNYLTFELTQKPYGMLVVRALAINVEDNSLCHNIKRDDSVKNRKRRGDRIILAERSLFRSKHLNNDVHFVITPRLRYTEKKEVRKILKDAGYVVCI